LRRSGAALAAALVLSYPSPGHLMKQSVTFMDRSITHSDRVGALISPELKLIYETAPIGLAFLSTDCRYLLINQPLTEICGISVADHIGRTVRETVPDVADEVENIVLAVLRTGQPVLGIAINGQRPDKQNAERLWITNWHPLKGPEGTIIGISVVAEEISERKRAEAALRELNRTLEQRVEEEAQERLQIWNVCQDLLVICDLEGIFLKVNPAWTATLGWHESELLGKSSQWMIHPDDRRQALVETENLAAGRILHRFGLRFRGKNGSYRWLSWRAVPHQGRIYAMARDETEQKHAEDRLREAQQELERVSRQTTIGAMTASIAHEINQPLSAIIASGNAGLRWLTRKDPDLDEVQKVLQGIVDDGLRAADIITSIRGMFRKDNHERLLLSVNDLVREVLTLIHGDLERRQIILRSEFHEALPKITGERVPLQQVLLNLIMNAADAMSAVTGRERLLTIQAARNEQTSVRVTVEDTGCGIDQAHVDRIFDPFFTTKSHGMGLGLSICRSIIEAHGGRLWVLPRSPFGTAFHLTLPSAEATLSFSG
jgi:PAS domain S-box-containing protein